MFVLVNEGNFFLFTFCQKLLEGGTSTIHEANCQKFMCKIQLR